MVIVTKENGEITSLVGKAYSDGLMGRSISVIGKRVDGMEWEN